ncbi:hypothetical protein C2S51_035683 [Perilla frutescens var. frutescens]|nr:hypothetical protein C2S51_035683 [Perilla frutescens var. frutescens]
MPPEITYCHHPLITPRTPLLPRVSPKSRFKRILHQNYCQGVRPRMKFTKKKTIPVLVFILFGASIFRFLNINMITNFSVSLPSAAYPLIHQQHECSLASSLCRKNASYSQAPSRGRPSTNASSLTEKESRFILELFSHRVPCNLLVFGSAYQYSSIAYLNAGGVTIFLEDYYLDNTSTVKPANNTQVHKIMYNTIASEAYQLLRDARENPHCSPKFYLPNLSKCNLALLNLPQEVYDTMWDAVVVDGPSGSSPESPGRMASIYTASILARRGNSTTHVIIHDVDRMIEKWFSWEFLCEENLVSSKARFWHFQLVQVANATTFCTP